MMMETRLRDEMRQDLHAVHWWSKRSNRGVRNKRLVLCFALLIALVMPLIPPCTLNREIKNKRSGIKTSKPSQLACSLAHNPSIHHAIPMCTPNPLNLPKKMPKHHPPQTLYQDNAPIRLTNQTQIKSFLQAMKGSPDPNSQPSDSLPCSCSHSHHLPSLSSSTHSKSF